MSKSELEWIQRRSSEFEWVQVKSSQIKWAQLSPSEIRWARVSPSEFKRARTRSSELKWVQVGSRESKWDLASLNESKWGQESLIESKWNQLWNQVKASAQVRDRASVNSNQPPSSPQSSYPTLVACISIHICIYIERYNKVHTYIQLCMCIMSLCMFLLCPSMIHLAGLDAFW